MSGFGKNKNIGSYAIVDFSDDGKEFGVGNLINKVIKFYYAEGKKRVFQGEEHHDEVKERILRANNVIVLDITKIKPLHKQIVDDRPFVEHSLDNLEFHRRI
jgi:hypothetical protein